MRTIAFLFLLSIAASCFGQKQPRTFLFVHGAWSGGWDYAKVDSILRIKGDIVYRPTLTGVGEREHLSAANVNLTTHITDIVNVIRFENLKNVVLIGHSYAGMVITGVAEHVPDRISQLIYLDSMVPNDGESARDVCGDLWDILMAPNVRDSVMLYPFGKTKSTPPRDVPQPLKTFTEPVSIRSPLAKTIPAAYILMTTNGKSDGAKDKMGVTRARARHWRIYTLEGGHYAMREQPGNLVKTIEAILQDNGKWR